MGFVFQLCMHCSPLALAVLSPKAHVLAIELCPHCSYRLCWWTLSSCHSILLWLIWRKSRCVLIERVFVLVRSTVVWVNTCQREDWKDWTWAMGLYCKLNTAWMTQACYMSFSLDEMGCGSSVQQISHTHACLCRSWLTYCGRFKAGLYWVSYVSSVELQWFEFSVVSNLLYQ